MLPPSRLPQSIQHPSASQHSLDSLQVPLPRALLHVPGLELLLGLHFPTSRRAIAALQWGVMTFWLLERSQLGKHGAACGKQKLLVHWCCAKSNLGVLVLALAHSARGRALGGWSGGRGLGEASLTSCLSWCRAPAVPGNPGEGPELRQP